MSPNINIAFAALFNGETKIHLRAKNKTPAVDHNQLNLFDYDATQPTAAVDGELTDRAQKKLCNVKVEVVNE